MERSMQLIFILCFLSLSLAASVPTPKEFSGLWYEIARTPNDFEKKCVAATVEYTLTSSNEYEVTNRCFDTKIGGDLIVYNGKGKTLQPNSASKLKLTYFWVFSREYHLIHWDQAYAVMASSDFQNLWIMSRTPQMPKATLDGIVKKLSTSIDIKRLIFTPQDPKGKYQ